MTLRDSLLQSRYLLDGETEDGLWRRVADFVAISSDKEECYQMLKRGDIIFNSPILMNAGKSTPLASACYVLPMEDSMDSIMDAQTLSAKIFKLGAGVGIDYSKLRPEGSPVGSGGTSSGPVSFMSLVDNLAEVIKSGGKRRAAIMATLRVDHPDIDKFIVHKQNDDRLLNTNISVMITDAFMQSVEAGEPVAVKRWNSIVHNAWKRGDPGLVFIDTINDTTNGVVDRVYEGVNACVTGDTNILTRDGYKEISSLVDRSVEIWNGEEWSEVVPKVTGKNEPILRITLTGGYELKCTTYHRFLLVDHIIKGSECYLDEEWVTADQLQLGDMLPVVSDHTKIITGEVIVSIEHIGIADKVYCFNEPIAHRGVFNGILTMNCSEYALYPYESCLIGSVNFATLPVEYWYNALSQRVRLLVRCLDNVIDKAWYPSETIKEAAQKYRRIGVGITGLADFLIKSGLRYGSDESLTLVDCVTEAMDEIARQESYDLANQFGPFPEFPKIKWDSRINSEDRVAVRNIATTVVAPAGSTSILCNASGSGCEPLFALAYDRMMRKDKEEWHTVLPDVVKECLEPVGILLTDDRIREIKDNNGSVQGLSWVPKEYQEFLVTAQDITPEDHLNMLAYVQRNIANGVSKTINLPNNATEEDVDRIFRMAYKGKIKGITVFRDGCKSAQVMKTTSQKQKVVDTDNGTLPDFLPGIRIKISTPSGGMYVLTTFYNNRPVEVFCNLGKSGMDDYAYTEALGRLVSLCLKKGIDHQHIVKTLKGIRGKDISLFRNDYVYSVPDAVAIALRESVNIFNGSNDVEVREMKLSKNLCPECHMPLHTEGKCPVCYNCGYNQCS